MIKIFNAAQIKAIDKTTIEEKGVSSHALMEKASLAIYNRLIKLIDPAKRIYVFAGTGNNGGDALAVARMLIAARIKTEVYIVNPGNTELSPDCETNRQLLEKLTKIHTISINKDIPKIYPDSIIIDGLFGSGLNRLLIGVMEKLIHVINKSENIVYSIDIPSGMFMDDNSANNMDNIVKATEVFSFQFPKLSLLLPESEFYYKDFSIVDIALSENAIEQQHTPYNFIEISDIKKLLRPRPRFSHKGTFGHAFLIVGSLGKMGAAIMASKACLRTGVGLLTVHIPKCGMNMLPTVVPEAMINIDTAIWHNSYIDKSFNDHIIGIGSGIGTHHDTNKMIYDMFSWYQKPMVIDADALNIIASDVRLRNMIPPGSILTPHPAEFERLIDHKCHNGYERLQQAREYAKKQNVYIVLKGAFTAVITPDMEVYFNPTGNPGMATGGSGDVLTGILTSLLAQKYPVLETCLLGVYLHGLAGDLAAEELTQPSMLPTDLIEYLGKAYKVLEK